MGQISWPDGVRCPVVLSFDLDAELLWNVWLTREPSPIDISQGVYGPRVGLPRVLAMLGRQEVRGTFFVPGAIAERYPEAAKSIASAGHEIAHHGYLHEDCSKLTKDEERKMLIQGGDALFRVTGVRPKGARLSLGKTTISNLDDLGFVYESTLMDDDQPYRLHSEGGKSRMIELPVTFAFNDTSYFAYTFGLPKPFLTPREVEVVYRDEFDAMYREQKYCMFMLHPQVIGRASRLDMLERTVEYMKSKPGVWFATALEVAEHCQHALG
ncbi:MAG: polysaccharide deacetylase [Nitrososphaerota archaeon]|nr:polysaccharide deacetylase [Nitrososphaerota archaeon]